MLVAIFLTFLVISSMAQVPGTGPCAPLQVMNYVNQTKVIGKSIFRWRTAGKMQNDGNCPKSRWYHGRMNNVDTRIQQLKLSNGTMTVVGPPDVSTYGFNISFLGTDYVSYLVKGTCNNVGPSSLNYYWVETRSRSPSQETLAKAEQVLKEEGIPEAYFVKEDQSDCPSDSLDMILNRVS